MKSNILLRYNEIALKGKNRAFFEQKLATNAQRLIQRAYGHHLETKPEVKFLFGRILLTTPWNETAQTALKRLFGCDNFSPVREVDTSLLDIEMAALEEFSEALGETRLHRTFRVQTRRTDKVVSEKSEDINRRIGSAILTKFQNVSVDLDNPEITLDIEIRRSKSWISVERHEGPHGLPVGTNGKLLALLSGGIDSPVSAIRSLKRGCSLELIHFHGAPYTGDESLEKVHALANKISQFSPQSIRLWTVRFGEIQAEIAKLVPPHMRTLFYRRLMLKISNRVATWCKAHALVTGEAIGQVASQTLENLTVINQASQLAVLRPLVGYDKNEIITLAKTYETYKTSILPALDCCTLFSERHPILHSNLESVLEIESKTPQEELITQALRGTENSYF